MRALLLLVAAPIHVPGGQEDPLERARELLESTKEEECRDGRDLCVEADSAAAVELLLDVLRLEDDRGGYLPTAHYRDDVWDGLRRIRSRPARERVAAELENKKHPRMRQWCTELLGEYGDPAFAEPLLDALADKELDVRRAAARAIGKLRIEDDGAPLRQRLVQALGKHAGDKDPVLRANAIEARARLAPAEFAAVLADGLKDADAGVRCALLFAAGTIDAAASEGFAAAALSDPDWRPRLRAVEVLSRARTRTALHHLVQALGDARPIVVARATQRLQELTGEKHTRREAWEAWWAAQGESFDPAAKRKAPQRARDDTRAVSFIGIDFESDHTAFLIDCSAGMAKDLQETGTSKAAAALAELEATLTRLQGRMRFSLHTYANEVTPFAKKQPVELDARSQEKALEFVRGQPLAGSKDIWQALETVLSDPTIDTVFLLSSGEPEIGLYVHWNRVTWHLAELNRFRGAVVHAIAYSDEDWYRQQLEKIAAATGGEFRAYE